jgi:CubicO group peptidase (beta-lactamase class C family)
LKALLGAPIAALMIATSIPSTPPLRRAHPGQQPPSPFGSTRRGSTAPSSDMVGSGRAAGTLALVYKDGREVYFGTAGHADREAGAPIRRDTLFQIFSMTKPVTGVALMQLWEQGRFGLDDPLAMHLPEYAATKVYKGMDPNGQPILAAPSRPILIRDVLRHTAGFGYGPGESYPEKQFEAADPLNLANDLDALSRKLATVPLAFEPGTRWHYSAAVDVQARLVEKLSGMVFADYVRTHVLEPLGMKETGWSQPETSLARLARAYAKGADGKLARMSDTDFQAHELLRREAHHGRCRSHFDRRRLYALRTHAPQRRQLQRAPDSEAFDGAADGDRSARPPRDRAPVASRARAMAGSASTFSCATVSP